MNKKVGDKVYISAYHGSRTSFYQGEVVKVTPSGKIDVRRGEVITRYKADGRIESSSCSWKNEFIDSLPFEERTAHIAQEGRAQIAANLLGNVAKDRVHPQWGKNTMWREVCRLTALLDQARAAVLAIDGAPIPEEIDLWCSACKEDRTHRNATLERPETTCKTCGGKY